MERLSGELVAGYASLFAHCWGQYAVQQGDGSYWRVAEPLTLPLLAAHLEGRWTLGTYLLDEGSCCAFAVFDADGVDGLRCLAELAGGGLGGGGPKGVEGGGGGGGLGGELGGATTGPRRCALVPAHPVGCGGGAVVGLPLGIHRQSRGWYPFVQLNAWGEWVPVGETVAACCAWVCQHVQQVAVPAAVVLGCAEVSSGWSESRMGSDVGASARMASHLSYGSIREWCQAQESVAVIGRYVVLDGRGVGSCPFKDHHARGDLRPSFQVFGGSNPHWDCYTWGRAGNLLDLLCLYYQLATR